MSHRSPARFLAPLVLIAACATIYLVVHAGLKDISSTGTTSTTTTSSTTKASSTTSKRSTSARKAKAKTYKVKAGDVLGDISKKTDVSVDDLLSYNRLDAADPLRVGQKLKLAP